MTGWYGYLIHNGRYVTIPAHRLFEKTVHSLLEGPYVLKFEIEGKSTYATQDFEVFEKLKVEGKQVFQLSDVFEALEKKFNAVGLEGNIHDWTLQNLKAHKMLLDVFPGSRFKEPRINQEPRSRHDLGGES